MKILFIIECLRSGGKERRLVELLKIISTMPEFECKLVLMEDLIHYKDRFPQNVEIIVLKRKIFKKDIRVFFKLCTVCKKFTPDIIHAWGNMPAYYAIPAKLLYGIPLINSQITDAPEIIPRGLVSPYIAFKFSDRIIANSFAGINAYNPPREKSTVIYNGFNFTRTGALKPKDEIRNKFGIYTKHVIGMVASFSVLKDYQTFIEAGMIVITQIPDVTIVCVGSGDVVQYRMNIPLHYEQHFRFLQQQVEIESIINIFDVGVLATYTEGISNSILEYMALEKPVVATDGGGTAELVINNETGYLVPPKNAWLMAEKIIGLLRDEGKQKIMGQKGKTRVETEFSMEKMITMHLEEYKKFIKK
jgi:glycosyltransferase involved in cell wall biosynthesis